MLTAYLSNVDCLSLQYKEPRIFKIMSDIFKTWKALVGVVMLGFFSTCMTALIGMHLIGGSRGQGVYEGYPRTNFETFSDAMLASFQFMLGVGWSGTLSWYTESFRIHEDKADWAWLPQVFLCMLFMWTNAILFNMFVAVLLINFGMDEHLKMPAQKTAYYKWAKRHVDENMALMETIQDDTARGEEKKKQQVGSEDLVATLTADLNTTASHRSFFIFRPANQFRMLCAKVISGNIFPNVWVLLCVLSCMSISLRSNEVMELMEGNDGVISDEGKGWKLFFITIEILVVSKHMGFCLRSSGLPYHCDHLT